MLSALHHSRTQVRREYPDGEEAREARDEVPPDAAQRTGAHEGAALRVPTIGGGDEAHGREKESRRFFVFCRLRSIEAVRGGSSCKFLQGSCSSGRSFPLAIPADPPDNRPRTAVLSRCRR